MRVDVKKYLLFGPESQKKEFCRKAQKLGVIEFIDHSGQKFDIIPDNVKKMNQAVKILQRVSLKRQVDFENVEEARKISIEIIERYEKLEKLFEQKRLVAQEMSRVQVFGDFLKEDVDFIENNGRCFVQFFFAKDKKKIPDDSDLIYVGQDHDLYYFVSINKKKTSFDNMIEMKVEKPYPELLDRKKEIDIEIKQLEFRLKELSTYKTLIKHAIVHEFNNYRLQVNQGFVDHHYEESFFSVEVWISESKLDEVDKIMDSFSIHMSAINVDDGEVQPTYLENKGPSRIGEDLVYIYDVPSNTDKDPSNWVLWSFTLFFAFIVGDGGYGFIFLIIAALMYWKIKNPSPGIKRFTSLLGILAIACIVWGFAITSFFGIDFNLENSFKKNSPVTYLVEKKLQYHINHKDEAYQEATSRFPHLKNVMMPYQFLTQAKKISEEGSTQYVVYDDYTGSIMLELALMIGVFHLMFSMVRGLKQSLARIGWVFFLIGAYLYFPKVVGATSMIHYWWGIPKTLSELIGPYILFFGIGVALIFAVIQEKWAGLAQAMTLVEVFADTLSYLRLYALALAGSIMANTFNLFGHKMVSAYGMVVGLIIAVFIVILGHSLNIILSIMGGVIHGLRLNFLEWYHYSFEGGGKKHKPLALLGLRK